MGGWLQFGRGEVGWGRRRRNRGREEKRVSVEAVYTGVYRRHHRRKYSVGKPVGDFTGVCDTSLLGCPGLNPSVFSLVNSSEKNPHHPAVAFSKKISHPSAMPLVYTDRIIPSVYTGGIVDDVFLSANSDMFFEGIISVGKFYRRNFSVCNSVGVIRFSGSVIHA
jgi:hypothetical protein